MGQTTTLLVLFQVVVWNSMERVLSVLKPTWVPRPATCPAELLPQVCHFCHAIRQALAQMGRFCCPMIVYGSMHALVPLLMKQPRGCSACTVGMLKPEKCWSSFIGFLLLDWNLHAIIVMMVVAGEGVVGESDVPSPRRPVPRAHQGSPARGFLHPSNIAIGAER